MSSQQRGVPSAIRLIHSAARDDVGSTQHVLAGELMTRHVPCVRAELQLEELVRLFIECGLKSLPVVEKCGRVIGMVEEADVHLDIHRSGHSERAVQDVMSPIFAAVREDTPMGLVAAVMLESGARCLPVLSSHCEVVGMLHTRDILRWLARGEGPVESAIVVRSQT